MRVQVIMFIFVCGILNLASIFLFAQGFTSKTPKRSLSIGKVTLKASSSDRSTILITGANRGIGYECAAKLLGSSNANYDIILACRDKQKGEMAKSRMMTMQPSSQSTVEVMELNLADLNSVSAFCKTWGKRPLDVLCLNAGIQVGKGIGVGNTGGEECRRTRQGFELTVGTNHIGHFALMRQLMPNIENTYRSKSKTNYEGPSGRIVIVGSGVHDPEEPGGEVGSKATLGDLSGLKRGFLSPDSMVDGSAAFDSDKAYKDSKLCNVATSLEVARRLGSSEATKGITCNVMNPGLCPTSGLFRDLNPIFVAIFTFITRYVAKVAVTESEGGRRLAYMVESPMLNSVTGGYFSGKPGYYAFEATMPSKEARNQATGKLLYDLTDKIVQNYV